MGTHHLAAAVAATTALGVLAWSLLALRSRGSRRTAVEAPGACSGRDEFDAAVARLRRSARFVGTVVIDLEGGAQDGATAALEQVTRARDVLLRTDRGFVLLLPGCPSAQVATVARRVEAALGAVVPVWVGLAHGTGLDLMDVLSAADEDLARSRRHRTAPGEAA